MTDAAAPGSDRVLLQAAGLTRRFGGLAAVQNVSIELRRGEVHAVIGTNGAGKSTLVNMLSGELAPSDGTVRLGGIDITRWSQPSGRAPASAAATSAPTSSTSSACSRMPAVGAGRPSAALGVLAGRAHCARSGPVAEAARCGGLSRQRGRRGRHPQPRRKAPARDRDVPGDPAAGAAARRAARRHGRRRDRTDARPARRAEGRTRGAAGRARHGRRVPHRRSHHGDGQRRGHRVDGPDAIRATPTCSVAYLGEDA